MYMYTHMYISIYIYTIRICILRLYFFVTRDKGLILNVESNKYITNLLNLLNVYKENDSPLEGYSQFVLSKFSISCAFHLFILFYFFFLKKEEKPALIIFQFFTKRTRKTVFKIIFLHICKLF